MAIKQATLIRKSKCKKITKDNYNSKEELLNFMLKLLNDKTIQQMEVEQILIILKVFLKLGENIMETKRVIEVIAKEVKVE